MRTVIIGDIHGCSGTLQKLLALVKPEIGKDRLAFLGDLFDRGPESREVLLTVMQLAESFGQNFILLRGNHEDYLLNPHLTIWQKKIWERVGRQATVDSFKRAGEKMEDAIPWVREHAQLFWKTELFQCAHAGVLVEPLEANDLRTLVHDHDVVIQNRYTGKLTITGHIALEQATWFAGDGETSNELADNVVYDLPENGVICIDTGCGKGGRLTAMAIEEKQFLLYSVPE